MEQIHLRMDEKLLADLKHLHKKEGPIHPRTKKRRPFNVYLRSILAEHASEHMLAIKRKEAVKDWKGDEFD